MYFSFKWYIIIGLIYACHYDLVTRLQIPKDDATKFFDSVIGRVIMSVIFTLFWLPLTVLEISILIYMKVKGK